jgi:hypothetical protein
LTRHVPIVALLTAAALLIALPATSHAAVYYVTNCGPDGINRAWTPSSNTSLMTSGAWCSPGSRGLFAQTASGGSPQVPAYGYAMVSAESPPGTYIDRADFAATVMTVGDQWFAGLFDAMNQRWIWCGRGCSSSVWRQYAADGFATPKIAVMARCEPGCVTNWLSGFASIGLRDVTLRVQDLWDPIIKSASGPLLANAWLRGRQAVSVRADDNAGIAEISVVLDGARHRAYTEGCDGHLMRPCPGPIERTLNAELEQISDGSHALELRAVDPAGRVAVLRRTIRVDNHPPGPVDALTTDESGWGIRNQFALRWRNPGYANAAPIAAVVWQACRIDATSRTATECRPPQITSGIDVDSLEDVHLPAPGEWAVRVWLTDAAGNVDSRTARQTVVRWDPDAPTVKFLPTDDSAPTTIRVQAADATSGLRTVELELKREGDRVTRALPVSSNSGVYSTIIDDELLPDGDYVVRAHVVDAAGNERTVESEYLHLPARIGTTLRVGKRERRARGAGKSGYVLRHRALVGFARTARLRGRLLTPGGNPLGGRDLTVAERVDLPEAEWRSVALIRTDPDGRFVFRAPAGPSRALRFRFGGAPNLRGATTDVKLAVRGSSSIAVSRRSVVNGEAVRFRGVVGSRPVPQTGKLLQLQVRSRGHWLTFATPHSDARGNWGYSYRFTATRGVTRYRFRVRLPREAGSPYAAGVSRAVRVRVVGL